MSQAVAQRSAIKPPKSKRAAARTRSTYSDRALEYAQQVCAEKILACLEVRQACKRFIDDLKRSERKSYRWIYDSKKADRFCRFFEAFPHYKNDFKNNAGKGATFRLEPWQCFGLCNIFGWVDKKTGYRRFTEVYWEVPRKNGKTPMAAGIGLYCLAAEGEFGAEVFAGAKSEKQAADGLFLAAKQMAQSSAEFREAFGVWVNANSIVVQARNASFKPLKGNPQDGPAPSCVLADEYHEYKTDRLIDWARTGMVSRSQPLLFEITTAGTNLASPCYVKHLEVQEVLAGRRVNDRLWGIIYTVDKGIPWTSRKALLMANPNWDISVNPSAVSDDQEQAKQSTIRQTEFKTKHLNIWGGEAAAWMNMNKWDNCADPTLSIEDFAGDECIMGVDLASRRDTISTARMFKRNVDGVDHFYCFTRHYLNEQQIRDPRHTHYQDWADHGHLIETPGDVTSYLKLNEDLAGDSGHLLLRELVFDPFHAAPLIQFLQERDDWNNAVEIVELKQNESEQSAPMKEFEAVVYEGRFHHAANPVMDWMMSNTVCKISERENWRPTRKHIDQKIDGTIAILLAYARWMARTDPYTDPDIGWA